MTVLTRDRRKISGSFRTQLTEWAGDRVGCEPGALKHLLLVFVHRMVIVYPTYQWLSRPYGNILWVAILGRHSNSSGNGTISRVFSGITFPWRLCNAHQSPDFLFSPRVSSPLLYCALAEQRSASRSASEQLWHRDRHRQRSKRCTGQWRHRDVDRRFD